MSRTAFEMDALREAPWSAALLRRFPVKLVSQKVHRGFVIQRHARKAVQQHRTPGRFALKNLFS
jgi:hypothetical protein